MNSTFLAPCPNELYFATTVPSCAHAHWSVIGASGVYGACCDDLEYDAPAIEAYLSNGVVLYEDTKLEREGEDTGGSSGTR